MSDYYNRAGEPISMEDWMAGFKPENQIVAKTKVGKVEVSTVWLGLDHNFGNGPPLIFETMIFGGPLDQQQWRYSTQAEACEGHIAAVRDAKAAAE